MNGGPPADGRVVVRVPVPMVVPMEVEEFLSWMASERGRSRNTLSA